MSEKRVWRRSAAGLAAAILCAGAVSLSGKAPPVVPDRIILVTIDTLRADHLPTYGYPRPTAPFLTSLARKGWYYRRAYTASAHTGPSHASLFTSLYPFQHGLQLNGQRMHADVPTLAGLLRSEGYRTAAFSAVRFLSGAARGFEVQSFRQNKGAAPRAGRAVVEEAITWLSTLDIDENFFLWIHLFDVHQYAFPGGAYGRTLAKLEEECGLSDAALRKFLIREHGTHPAFLEDTPDSALPKIRSYDGRIRYVDQVLERLHAVTGKLFPEQRTLWIVTSDHGEGLGSHAYMGHGWNLYQDQLHVPLIMAYSDGSYAGRRHDPIVRHVDILPSIAAAVGLPRSAWEGRPVWPFVEKGDDGARAYGQRRPARLPGESGELFCLQDRRAKYFWSPDGNREEFYDLEKDPLERRNIVDKRRADADRLRNELTLIVGRLRERKKPDQQIPESLEEELRALGY